MREKGRLIPERFGTASSVKFIIKRQRHRLPFASVGEILVHSKRHRYGGYAKISTDRVPA